MKTQRVGTDNIRLWYHPGPSENTFHQSHTSDLTAMACEFPLWVSIPTFITINAFGIINHHLILLIGSKKYLTQSCSEEFLFDVSILARITRIPVFALKSC